MILPAKFCLNQILEVSNSDIDFIDLSLSLASPNIFIINDFYELIERRVKCLRFILNYELEK